MYLQQWNTQTEISQKLPLAYLASSKVGLLVQTLLRLKCHEDRASSFERAGSRPVLDDWASKGLCPRSHPATWLCVWGGWAGTQPVIPALWSSLTKREAGTAQPARTHTCKRTHSHADAHRQSGARGQTLSLPPVLTPSLFPPIPRAKGHTLAVRFQAAAGNTLSLALSYTHTCKHTPRDSGQPEKDVKASGPVPRRGEKIQEEG